MPLILFFFFQAEDGIRVGHVTGVQTCALPISAYRGGWSGTPPPPRTPTWRVSAGGYGPLDRGPWTGGNARPGGTTAPRRSPRPRSSAGGHRFPSRCWRPWIGRCPPRPSSAPTRPHPHEPLGCPSPPAPAGGVWGTTRVHTTTYLRRSQRWVATRKTP